MSTYSPERVAAATRARWGRRTEKQRLFEKVQIDLDSGCWNWTAGTDDGYGRFETRGKYTEGSHVVMYRVYNGAVPEGLTLDHLCRNTLCCNPEHLEPVTRAENSRRQMAAIDHYNTAKTHCPQGHEYSPENTRFSKQGYGRVCRTCAAKQSREYRLRKKAGL